MQSVLIFFVGMFLGGILEFLTVFLTDMLFHKKLRINHRFTYRKKISFFSLPIWGLLLLMFNGSNKYVLVFLYSAVLGTLLEAGMGKLVTRIYGAKIWTYKRGALGDFTSIYSIPYWGAAGVVFASIGKVLGL